MIELKFIEKMISKAIIASLVLLCFSVEIIFISSKQAFAQYGDSKDVNRLQTIRTSNPDPHSATKQAIQDAVNAENYPEMHRLLVEFDKDPSLTVAERAYLANYYGNICFNINDLDCALIQFKRVVAMGEGVPEAFRTHMLYVIAQVLFSQENYPEALSYAQRWFKNLPEPTTDGYLLIGMTYYQLKEYNKALSNVINGIEIPTSKRSVPKESSLNLLIAIYRKTGQLEKTVPVFKQLIEHYPKEIYQLTLNKVKKDLGHSTNSTRHE